MYFVTICTKNREHYFGEISDGIMHLNDHGNIIKQQLNWLTEQYKYVNLDCQIIMPNHVHLIVEIISTVGTGRDLSLPTKIKPLSELMGAFKTTSSKLIHRFDCNSFSWQRSFYDHIIRNEISLNKIREYIINNPKNWERDRNNAENILM